jgi:hypothetical protein
MGKFPVFRRSFLLEEQIRAPVKMEKPTETPVSDSEGAQFICNCDCDWFCSFAIDSVYL